MENLQDKKWAYFDELTKNYRGNRNLFVAENIKKIIEREPSQLTACEEEPWEEEGKIYLGIEKYGELNKLEFAHCLQALRRRQAIFFNHESNSNPFYYEEDLMDEVANQWFTPNLEKLNEFIVLSRDKFYGFQIDNKEELKNILETLNFILLNNANSIIKLANKDRKHIETIELIADYTDYVGLTYTLEADFDYNKETGQADPVGAYPVLEYCKIWNAYALEELRQELLNLFSKEYKNPVKLFLTNNKGAKWRCVKCGRFLDDLDRGEKIKKYLENFFTERFKACYKCRKKNYFEINERGEIFFKLVDLQSVNSIKLKMRQNKFDLPF